MKTGKKTKLIASIVMLFFGQGSMSNQLSAQSWNLTGNSPTSTQFIGTTGAQDLRIRTNNLQRVVVTTSGNVGIGTTNPGTFRLAVEGKIGAREIVVTSTSPWPDYVFHNGYKLLDLKEVEHYIHQYKHLPNIPSAKEVAGNGVELGTLNAKLLEKIEEITLYLIEIKKENEKLKRRMDVIEE